MNPRSYLGSRTLVDSVSAIAAAQGNQEAPTCESRVQITFSTTARWGFFYSFYPPGGIVVDKAAWRAEMLRRRESLPPEKRRLAARRIAQGVLSLTELQDSSLVGLYADFRGEVPTARLAYLLCLAGKAAALPVAEPQRKTMAFHLVTHRHQLQIGAYGIREPSPGCRPVSPRDLDLLIVPGVGFDRRGYRLGYGAGYYDRFLSGLAPGCPAVGLAFACQVAPLLPHDPLDRPVDLIVTEDEIIRTAMGGRGWQ